MQWMGLMICYGMAVKRGGDVWSQCEEDEDTDCEDGRKMAQINKVR